MMKNKPQVKLLKDFPIKAIEKTVDVFQGATPNERRRLLIEERYNYSKESLDAIFSTLSK